MLVSRYFADDLKDVDTKSVTFSDAKDGGDIAGEQKFIEDTKEKDYWKSYELAYVTQNPDGGLPTDLYKALVVAKNKGLIGNETRWDEALTRSEAVEFIVGTLRLETGIDQFSAKQGLVDGYEVEITTETEETTVDDGINSTHTDIILGDDEYKGDNGNDALQNNYNNLTEDRQAEVDEALQRAKERHPEWFQDDNSGDTGNNKAPGYVSVDAPVDNDTTGGANNGYVFGSGGDSGVAAGTVY